MEKIRKEIEEGMKIERGSTSGRWGGEGEGGGWQAEIQEYWKVKRGYGRKRIEDLNETKKERMGAMVARTARLDNERKTKGMVMEKRMELVYLRMATCHDGEAWELLEERAGVIEDLHLAGLIEDVIEGEKQRGAKRIWNDKKIIKIG